MEEFDGDHPVERRHGDGHPWLLAPHQRDSAGGAGAQGRHSLQGVPCNLRLRDRPAPIQAFPSTRQVGTEQRKGKTGGLPFKTIACVTTRQELSTPSRVLCARPSRTEGVWGQAPSSRTQRYRPLTKPRRSIRAVPAGHEDYTPHSHPQEKPALRLEAGGQHMRAPISFTRTLSDALLPCAQAMICRWMFCWWMFWPRRPSTFPKIVPMSCFCELAFQVLCGW